MFAFTILRGISASLMESGFKQCHVLYIVCAAVNVRAVCRACICSYMEWNYTCMMSLHAVIDGSMMLAYVNAILQKLNIHVRRCAQHRIAERFRCYTFCAQVTVLRPVIWCCISMLHVICECREARTYELLHKRYIVFSSQAFVFIPELWMHVQIPKFIPVPKF